jgi:hypothetical protein
VALTQTYVGKTGYHTQQVTPTGKLIVAVEYLVDENPVMALLDTGAEYGVFPAELAMALGYDTQDGPRTVLKTRLGDYEGHLLRILITLPAQEGSGLDIELTWVVAPGWPGPPVIGWGGCLERLRFALDPTPGEDCFYFGPVSE